MREYAVQFLVVRDDGYDGGGLSPPLPVKADSAAKAVQEAVELAKRTVWTAEGSPE